MPAVTNRRNDLGVKESADCYQLKYLHAKTGWQSTADLLARIQET